MNRYHGPVDLHPPRKTSPAHPRRSLATALTRNTIEHYLSEAYPAISRMPFAVTELTAKTHAATLPVAFSLHIRR
jgi:hypothetical protein